MISLAAAGTNVCGPKNLLYSFVDALALWNLDSTTHLSGVISHLRSLYLNNQKIRSGWFPWFSCGQDVP